MFKFNFISSKEKKVVILDTLTSTYAEYCIPKNINYYIIGFRNEINVILSLKFFLLFCYFFLKQKNLQYLQYCQYAELKEQRLFLQMWTTVSLLQK